MRKSDEANNSIDRLFRNAERAGLGQKPSQQISQGQTPVPQPAQIQPPAQPVQTHIPQVPNPTPPPAQPAKRPRKAFRATRAVARGASGIWRLALNLMDLAVVAIVLAVIVVVLHGLVASGSLHVPASIGRLIDYLYSLVIQASGVVARHLTK